MSEDFVRPVINELKDYVPGKTPKDPGVIKLSSNENPFGPSPKALAAITKEEKNLHIYPDQKSILLREALAKTLGVADSSIIIGNGSDEIMQLAAATFLRPGEEIIISEHTFSVYEFVARIFDGKPVFVPLKNNEQDLEAMAKAITRKTKMIFLCSPHNPTGSYITMKQFNNFLEQVPDNVLVIIDEAYAEYNSAKDFPTSLKYIKEERNVLVLRTFSKFYGLAGLRIGYGIAKPELTGYMFRVKPPFNVNRLAQVGAVAALEDKGFLTKTYQANLEGKEYLYAELDKLGLEHKKTEANFIFINLKRSADEAFIELMRQGVIIRPLTSFGFPEAIRVTIGTKEQNKKLVAVLSKII
ncbi:histidinol-phosphate transaminase [candidate division WOR-1 bacterium RIFOXYB2_FULL_42_35]|uniref:Histidinol-phosphate aminotransferase n=1 Tax=candidate division WOR-1 bacterium RIFOXYC2_FULL_41_25 TaxID=1802586 RepID=A0A1F4TRM8_UNCSA|nr:MAG: histidinol-phosphate transaminase [candidate division WOR-1 bacterium RIFOXYA2_FULL_41_14]OGC25847.1 MAG: histidinol-phosphate transaminase [candidate division WOR-1 bacterium RIFOXYB2_FULL_42_35]OGC35287.1 MAG: histidinol-phosphate transaminase [candidate division WOR-1 bacterium RIFOXYC2_FULL_41_25]OGC41631.1 MAG: histidinol-phosphate transaminase [candidate division WOR-1 bacterium RIFOXYD2_FULL_41_8]